MVQAPRLQRIHQRLQDVLLAYRIGESLGPPFAGQNNVTHSVWGAEPEFRIDQCNLPACRRKPENGKTKSQKVV